jgi:biotin carboxylase
VILILGGGVMQLPSVRLARREGWRVAVAALDIGEEVKRLADICEQVDLGDREAVTEAARRIQEHHGLDGVFTAGTDFSTTVAWVAEKLELPGIPFACALAATDKSRMREAFDRQGVPSPRFFTVSAEGTAAQQIGANGSGDHGTGTGGIGGHRQPLPPGYRFPLVVKPVDNMGARGVRRVDGEQELRQAVSIALGQSRSRRAIIEEYLDGPELSLDAVVYGSRITVCGVADRHISFPPFFVEMGHTMPSALAPDVLRQAEEVFARGIRALGITEGAAKGDIKITSRGPVVGEIAARLSGGYMSGWTYPYASGVEVTAAALRIALGLPPGELSPTRSWVSAERAFISIPGLVREVEGLEQAKEGRWIEEVFLRVHPGGRVELPVNNLGKCGNVISKAPSREAAVTAAETGARRLLVRLAPEDPWTEEFLDGSRQGSFSAFAGIPPDCRRRIEEMHPFRGKPEAAGRRRVRVQILALPGIEREQTVDWHGFTLSAALERVIEATGVRCVQRPSPGAVALGSLFWRALLKGSVQAGIYLLDCLCSKASDPKQVLERWMRRW